MKKTGEQRTILIERSVPLKSYSTAYVDHVKQDLRDQLVELGCDHIQDEERAEQTNDGRCTGFIVKATGVLRG